MHVAAPAVWRSVALLRWTPGSKSLLCAYLCVLPHLQHINDIKKKNNKDEPSARENAGGNAKRC